MAGWIKVYRELADHWLAQDLLKLGWWTILLLRVNHEEKKVLVGNQLITVQRGQIVASLSYLAELWNTSKRSAERFVELLEQDNMVRRCTVHKVTILTICNYASYQDAKTSRCADTCADDAPIGIQSVSEIKKEEEVKEYNNNSIAHTREESIAWEESREREFVQTFVGVGAALPLSKVIGKAPQDVMRLLEVYMASRQLKNLGHKDYRHFLDGFQHAVKNNKISLTAQPQQKKVTGNDETRRLMEEMGWQK